MRYYVFCVDFDRKKVNIVKTSKVFTFKTYKEALDKFNNVKNTVSFSEGLFLVADFGTAKESLFKATEIDKNNSYIPYIILNKHGANSVISIAEKRLPIQKISILQDGIQQEFDSYELAFNTFDEYIKNNIVSELCIEDNILPDLADHSSIHKKQIIKLCVSGGNYIPERYMKKFKISENMSVPY